MRSTASSSEELNFNNEANGLLERSHITRLSPISQLFQSAPQTSEFQQANISPEHRPPHQRSRKPPQDFKFHTLQQKAAVGRQLDSQIDDKRSPRFASTGEYSYFEYFILFITAFFSIYNLSIYRNIHS